MLIYLLDLHSKAGKGVGNITSVESVVDVVNAFTGLTT